jgi:hypothetical protein
VHARLVDRAETGTSAMIFKITEPENLAEKCRFLLKTILFANAKLDHNIVFQEKRKREIFAM